LGAAAHSNNEIDCGHVPIDWERVERFALTSIFTDAPMAYGRRAFRGMT
jgi:hypothetical protein